MSPIGSGSTAFCLLGQPEKSSNDTEIVLTATEEDYQPVWAVAERLWDLGHGICHTLPFR